MMDASNYETPFVAENGVAVPLPSLPGQMSGEAIATNVQGHIVGWAGSSRIHAVVWIRGEVSQLTLPLGPSSVARSINNNDVIGGWMGLHPGIDSHAFLWADGKVLDIGTIPNGTGTVAGLNDRGDVAGWGVAPDPSGSGTISRGFHWYGGRMTIIDPLPGYARSAALDVNNSSVVVGGSWISSTAFDHGFLWQNGELFDLNDLVPQGSPEVLLANAINDSGQIAAMGLDDEGLLVALLLTPVAQLIGDLDCDGSVGGSDLGALFGAWGPCVGGSTCIADLDGNHAVDGADLSILLGAWTA